MNNETLYKSLKYIVLGCAVYGLMKYLPKESMRDMDALLIAVITVLSFIVLENLLSMYTNTAETNSCVASCTRKEGMATVGAPSEVKPEAKHEAKTEVKPEVKPEAKPTNAEKVGSRMEDDVITNDNPYTDYNTLPIGLGLDTRDYEYGYSFLPPDRWYPVPPHPPVCVTEKRCPVCPVFTTGTPVDVKEWNQTLRITPPDTINTKFIKEKLNAGR